MRSADGRPERQAATIDELEQEATALRAEVAAADGRVAQLSSHLASIQQAVRSERQAAELVRTALARAEVQLESLARREDEIERLRAALGAERSARVTAKQSATALNAKLEKTEAQVNDLQERLARAENDARGTEAEASELRGQVLELRTRAK